MRYTEKTAYGKINLGLDVTGRRDDGYHLLKMIMQSVGIYDTLTFSKNDSPDILIATNRDYLPTGPKNLIYRAVDLIREEYGIKDGISINLEKGIPVAAGMAGGSADAAVAILAMNEMFELGMDPDRMSSLGLRLGADIPFCIRGGTCLAEGIGEKLTSLPAMPDCSILIIKPGFGISTKYVYQAIDEISIPDHPDIDGIAEALRNGDISRICAAMGNVLELVSCREHPGIEKIKDSMRTMGADAAMMTGSGPAVFGIFTDAGKAEKAFGYFKKSEYQNGTFLTKPVAKY